MVKEIVKLIAIFITISIKSFPVYFHVIKTVYQQQLLRLLLQLLHSILLTNAIIIVI